jgi:hypothetical protein
VKKSKNKSKNISNHTWAKHKKLTSKMGKKLLTSSFKRSKSVPYEFL